MPPSFLCTFDERRPILSYSHCLLKRMHLYLFINYYVPVSFTEFLAIDNEHYTGNHCGHKNDYCYHNYDHID